MPTPIFCCGFECSAAGVGTMHGGFWGTAGSISATTFRTGARAWRANPTGSTSVLILQAGLAANARHVGRVYIRFATLPSADTALGAYGTSATNAPSIRFKLSDSKIYAGVGTTLGATGVAVTTGVWYRIDFDYNVNTAGNDTADVQVDGVACGQATAAGLSATSGNHVLGVLVTASADVFFDDFALSFTAADYPLGAGKVEAFTPTSDGTHSGLTAGEFKKGTAGTDIVNATTDAYTMVDDVPIKTAITTTDLIALIAPGAAADYVECIFGPAPGVGTPTTGPRYVEVVAAIHQASTATGNMEIRLNDGGTTAVIYTATAVAGVTSLVYKRAGWSDPPSSETVWNAFNDSGPGDFRNVRVRFGSPATVDAIPDQYLDSIMIEAEFAEVVTNAQKRFQTFPAQAVKRASYF